MWLLGRSGERHEDIVPIAVSESEDELMKHAVQTFGVAGNFAKDGDSWVWQEELEDDEMPYESFIIVPITHLPKQA